MDETEPADPQRHPSEKFSGYDVGYTRQPEWIIPSAGVADAECQILNNMQVKVGLHYCWFEVEKLDDDKFAVVCKSHSDS